MKLSSLLVPSGSSSWFQFVLCHQFHGVHNLGHETTSCSGYHNHCGSFYMPSWLSASFETCNTQKKWSADCIHRPMRYALCGVVWVFPPVIVETQIQTFNWSGLTHLVSICLLRLLKRLLSFWTSASCLSMSGQCSWNLVVMLSQLLLARRRLCSVSAIVDLLDLRSAAISYQSSQ